MRTILPVAVSFAFTCSSTFAQVLIAGGSSHAAPVAYSTPQAPTAPVAYAVPVVYTAQSGCASEVQVVSGGYYTPGNVIYVGGPNSCYKNVHQGYSYQNGCYYSSPNVIYFGRGEAHERGYSFRHYR